MKNRVGAEWEGGGGGGWGGWGGGGDSRVCCRA